MLLSALRNVCLGTGQSAKEVIDEHKISVSSESSGKQLNRSRNRARQKEKRNLPQSACFSLDSGSENENLEAHTNQVDIGKLVSLLGFIS